uniref:Uncharacterized protein n=1 Tax=Physcomitrium patens TaxID=3218 RepID=A0A2K1KMH6_PHYPA|nr:hypothetical protein PHYPA_005875 [Physcomitrium patens]
MQVGLSVGCSDIPCRVQCICATHASVSCHGFSLFANPLLCPSSNFSSLNFTTFVKRFTCSWLED